MIKNIYLLPLFLLTLSFVACNETEEEGKYANWRERNEAFIDSLQQVVDLKEDPELNFLVFRQDKKYKIFYKKLKSVPDGEQPVYTSVISCYYRGMFIDQAVFNANPTQKYYTKLYKDLTVFDNNTMRHGDDPTEFDSPASWLIQSFYTTSGVSAWADILEAMRVGERWEVYIPWQIAYGAAGNDAIPGYSTLMFDIILYRIDEW